jgi:hypothetical protein
METKVCSSCYLEKPLAAFHNSKRGLQGVRKHCKHCISKANGHKVRRIKAPEGFLYCYTCHEIKPLIEMRKCSKSRTGYCSPCKVCCVNLQRARYSTSEFREKQRAKYAANPANQKRYQETYKLRHKDRIDETQRNYKEKNRLKLRERNKRFKKEQIELLKSSYIRERLRRKFKISEVPIELIETATVILKIKRRLRND